MNIPDLEQGGKSLNEGNSTSIIDGQMVRALNHMEEAMAILEKLRKNAGGYGPKLDKGEAELSKAYALISAKRPI